ncbi:TPA: hypothetical protein U5E34_004013, partial [Yersinia enterocolitica]|nr:hypothetical protein [Yersinia enterocolitica]
MYISNIIQPNGHAKNISSNDARYRLSPCAKAISALLLVFSSTVAWAESDDNEKKTEYISERERLRLPRLDQVLGVKWLERLERVLGVGKPEWL